jgi:hypothetical protein
VASDVKTFQDTAPIPIAPEMLSSPTCIPLGGDANDQRVENYPKLSKIPI